ncbi:MAG: HAMP domain-containing sensor histidine kinase [Marivibrio sp.]|uniref:sensor histidine kinase n=1 Tax=Marivibrio sp. TaxID=2039719 RepID=UPI0032EC1F77
MAPGPDAPIAGRRPTPVGLAALLLCAAAGAAANWVAPEIFYGLELLIGPIFAVLAAVIGGPIAGALVGAAAAATAEEGRASFLVFALFVLEPAAVGYAARRWRANPVLSDVVFWLAFGAPALVAAYWLHFALDWWSILLIAAKTALNGALAALAASLLLQARALIPALSRLGGPSAPPSLRDVVFTAVLGAALIAGATPIAEMTRLEQAQAERATARQLSLETAALVAALRAADEVQDPAERARAALASAPGGVGAAAAVISVRGDILAQRGSLISLENVGAAAPESLARNGLTVLFAAPPEAPGLVRWRSARGQQSRLVGGVPDIALVVVERPLAPMVARVQAAQEPVLFLTLDLFVAALVLALLASLWLARPIRRLRLAAAEAGPRIAAGEGVSLPKEGVREVAELAQSLEDSANALSRAVQALEQARAEAADAKSEAMHASRAKTTFLSSVSHELRTPLNAILGFSEMLQQAPDGPLGSPRYEEYVAIIRRSGEHLLRVVNDMLDVAAIERGTLSLARAPVRLDRVLGDVARDKAAAAAERRLTVETNIDPETPVITGDPERLRQIAENLLADALASAGEGGRVEAEIGPSRRGAPGGVRLAISTESGRGRGDGFPATAFAGVAVLAGEAAYDEHGFGVGVSVARALVTLHGGTLRIESAPALGARIIVDFPAQPPSDPSLEGMAAE